MMMTIMMMTTMIMMTIVVMTMMMMTMMMMIEVMMKMTWHRLHPKESLVGASLRRHCEEQASEKDYHHHQNILTSLPRISIWKFVIASITISRQGGSHIVLDNCVLFGVWNCLQIFCLTQTGRWFLMCINGHHGNLLNCSWLKDILPLNDHQLLPRQLLKVPLHVQHVHVQHVQPLVQIDG